MNSRLPPFPVPAGATPVACLALLLTWATAALAGPSTWRFEWPDTDFSKHSVDYDEILSGGPPKDGIPSIDQPAFVPVAESSDLAPQEPVIGLTIEGDARAYPLRILTWHEIVNDEIGGIPIAVTYCPLCNTALAFDRRVDGEILRFGVSGLLRNSCLLYTSPSPRDGLLSRMPSSA